MSNTRRLITDNIYDRVLDLERAHRRLASKVAGMVITDSSTDDPEEEYPDVGSLQYVKRDGTLGLTDNWDAGSYQVRARTLRSDVATGTAPLSITSTTVVANLNVDAVDGYHLDQSVLIAASPTFANLTINGNISVTGNVDGVDVSAHAADSEAHQDKVTIGVGGLSAKLSLDDQELTLANIDHADLSNIDPNEHIDHTTVTLTAGNGLTGGGTIAASRNFAVGPGDGILVGSNDVSVDESYAFTWTAEHTFQADLQIDANIDFIGTQSITSSGHITLDSAFGYIYLSSFGYIELDHGLGSVSIAGTTPTLSVERIVGKDGSSLKLNDYSGHGIEIDYLSNTIEVYRTYDFSTSNWVSGLNGTGWGVTAAGAADFRELYSEEIRTHAFIAEIYSALAGALIITESRARLSRDFTIPDTGNTATLYVEDHEGFEDVAVFAANDYVLLRVVDTSGGGLVVSDVYGQVTGYSNLSGGEQSWTFTTTTTGYSASDEVFAGSIVLDYGSAGSGVWQATVLDANSPYSEVQTWSSVASGEPSNFTTWVRLGNLDGLSGIGSEYGLYAGDGLAVTDSYFVVSDSQATLHNIQFQIHDGSNVVFRIEPGTPYYSLGDPAPTTYGAGVGLWAGLDGGSYKFRVGNPAADLLEWDGTNLTITGEITAASGNIAGWVISSTAITKNQVSLKSNVPAIEIAPGGGDISRISFGDTWDGSLYTGHYGISAIDTSNNFVFRLDDSVQSIAGWTFDHEMLYSGTNTPGGGSFTGLVLDSGGITYSAVDYLLAGVDSGSIQVGIRASDGALVGGGGNVVLSADGLRLTASALNNNAVYWYTAGSVLYGYIHTDAARNITVRNYPTTGSNAYAQLETYSGLSNYARWRVGHENGDSTSYVAEFYVEGSTVFQVDYQGYISTTGITLGSPSKTASSQGELSIEDDLTVEGDTFLLADLDVSNDVDIDGGLYVGAGAGSPGAGDVYAEGYLYALGGIHVGGTSDPGDDNLIVDSDTRVGGGLYVGSTGTNPDADDIYYDGNLKSVKSATTYDVYAFHPLTTPLTHTSFNGDSFSSVGTPTIIQNTSWSSTIPADAKALLIQIRIRDSGSASASQVFFTVGPSSAQWNALACQANGVTNNATVDAMSAVPCTSGDIYYRAGASGAGTLDVWLTCWGYWL